MVSRYSITRTPARTALTLIIVCALAAVVVYKLLINENHPSRKSLLATFELEREYLEKLRSMFLEDEHLLFIDYPTHLVPKKSKSYAEEVWHADPAQFTLLPERFEEYVKLFKRLGIKHGINPFLENGRKQVADERKEQRHCARRQALAEQGRDIIACLKNSRKSEMVLRGSPAFIVSFQDTWWRWSWKGFRYIRPEDVSLLCPHTGVRNIDEIVVSDTRRFLTVCEPISGNWFLYYSRWS